MKRKRVQFETTGPTMTQQHLKEQCDVNSILEKYRKTGMLNHKRVTQGAYGDFTMFGDFKSNLEKVISAQTLFDQLPAQLRKKFSNDPAQLVEYLSNDKNYDEAVKLGFVVPRSEAPPKPQNDDKTTNSASKEPSATTTPSQA